MKEIYKAVQYVQDGLWYATYWDGHTRVKASEGFIFEFEAEYACYELDRQQETEKWLEEKVTAYAQNPTEVLEDMLSATNDVIEQYTNSSSLATKEVLRSCMEHNKLFLEKIHSLSRE